MGMPSTDWLYKACLTSWCVLAAHNAVLVWSFMLHHTDGVTDVSLTYVDQPGRSTACWSVSSALVSKNDHENGRNTLASLMCTIDSQSIL